MEKTDQNSGHYIIASSLPPEQQPLERRMFVPISRPQRLHRNSSAFKISVQISVFRNKKLFKNPVLDCRDIKQKPLVPPIRGIHAPPAPKSVWAALCAILVLLQLPVIGYWSNTRTSSFLELPVAAKWSDIYRLPLSKRYHQAIIDFCFVTRVGVFAKLSSS